MQEKNLLSNLNLRTIIDTVPAALFILDDNARILDLNSHAAQIVGHDSEWILRRLCGDVLHCINTKNDPETCGSTEFCPDCVVRNTVLESCSGKSVVKRRADLLIQKGENTHRRVFLISSSPFENNGKPLSLLSMEDITELVKLRGLIPVCAKCKSVRKDNDYWEKIETYLSEEVGVQMSHGICPDCANELYGNEDWYIELKKEDRNK